MKTKWNKVSANSFFFMIKKSLNHRVTNRRKTAEETTHALKTGNQNQNVENAIPEKLEKYAQITRRNKKTVADLIRLKSNRQ